MQIHNLKPKTKNKKRMIVARGGKRGKTAGRGTKGQKARAGRKIRPEIRDIIKRIPKMRGRGKNSNVSIQEKPFVVNIDTLDKHFASGDTVSPQALIAKGVISGRNGSVTQVKILGRGELAKKLTFKGVMLSEQVKAKLQASGSTIS